ncbi:MAG: methyltransferase domain-containing protein [Deltaproteobacteria bacterium]
MDQVNRNDFACPACRAALKRDGQGLVCASCSVRWPVQDGVADFRRERDRYWGEYPPQVMDRLLEACRQRGWLAAVKDFFGERDPGYYEYLTDKRRANWTYLVSLPRTARVLDVGCGWGALSFPLAQRFDEVYGLDIVPQRSALLMLRRQQERCPGVIPVCGEATHLPFADGFFDGIVLNGVLEWIPSTQEGDPARVQAAALKEACRVLKPGGILYVAIENRWAVINFLGLRDTHSGLRFAPILPRPVANLYSRLARGKDFREYTYTYGEHKRLLKAAGFGRACFFAPLPTYRRFYYFLPLDDARWVRFFLGDFVSSRNRFQRFFITVTRALRLYGLVKYFVPDFGIFAQKGAGGDAAVACNTILHQGVERVSQFSFESGADRPATVLKIYRDDQPDRWQRMCALMRSLYAHPEPLLAHSVPQVLRSWKEGGAFLVRETFVPGISLRRRAERRSPFWKREFIGHLNAVTAWLSAFHRVSVVGSFVFEGDAVRSLLQDLAAFVPKKAFFAQASAVRVPAVVCHGDLRPANVFATPQGLRVIDWDCFSMQGLPLMDLMEFILRYVHAHSMWQQDGVHLRPDVFRRYLDIIYLRSSALSTAVRYALDQYGKALGLDAQQRGLLFAYWAHRMFCPGRDKVFYVFSEK